MNNYFHTDDPAMIRFIAAVATTAAENGDRLRIHTDSRGMLRIKRGGGAWSPPLRSTEDMFRDKPLPS